MVIQGEQVIKVSAEETAIILDSLATQPFNKVNGLIQKLVGQIQQNMLPKEVVPDAEPKG